MKIFNLITTFFSFYVVLLYQVQPLVFQQEEVSISVMSVT